MLTENGGGTSLNDVGGRKTRASTRIEVTSDIRIFSTRRHRKEKWVFELCGACEKKYGLWETDAVNWIAG